MGSPDNVTFDENGMNAAIQFHILEDDEMRNAGFSDHREDNWYLVKRVYSDKYITITLNIDIPKDSKKRGEIYTLDESFLQPYNYQEHMDKPIAQEVAKNVEDELERLSDLGIISGHNRGDYI